MLLPSRNKKLGAYNLLKRRSNRNNEITARCAKERVKEDKGQKSEAQTEWESRSEREEKRQTCGAAETSKDHAERLTLWQKTLNTLGMPNIKGWPQSQQVISCQKHQGLFR